MPSRVKYTTRELGLLARMMRAEALGEGKFGMKLVGNVGINRVVAKCREFRDITSISQMIYSPNAFASTKSPLFFGPANATHKELALDTIKYWRADPATRSLFFRTPIDGTCQTVFFGTLIGKWKGHCFYRYTDVNCGL